VLCDNVTVNHLLHLSVQNKLVFNFWKLNIKLGPFKFGFDIKKGDKDAPCVFCLSLICRCACSRSLHHTPLCSWTPLFGSACNGAPTPQLNENSNASARRFDAKDKGLPFFVFFYIDDHIAVAKGRGGGWAYWARTDPKWDLEHGIV